MRVNQNMENRISPFIKKQQTVGAKETCPIAMEQIWNDPTLNALQLKREAMQLHVAEAAQKAEIEVCKKKAMEEISTQAAAERDKQRADISSRRELQTTSVEIQQSGEIRISRELFGSNLIGTVPFTYVESFMLKCSGNENERILYVRLLSKDKKKIEIYMDPAKLDDYYINKKCNSVGICFGFSHAKETLVRKVLINKVISLAKTVTLCPKHGWYEKDGAIGYAFPDTCTWEEVKKRV